MTPTEYHAIDEAYQKGYAAGFRDGQYAGYKDATNRMFGLERLDKNHHQGDE